MKAKIKLRFMAQSPGGFPARRMKDDTIRFIVLAVASCLVPAAFFAGPT
jgi:hypothetical protein